jgi:hypothetical protein
MRVLPGGTGVRTVAVDCPVLQAYALYAAFSFHIDDRRQPEVSNSLCDFVHFSRTCPSTVDHGRVGGSTCWSSAARQRLNYLGTS